MLPVEASEGAPIGLTGPLADEEDDDASVVVFSFLNAFGSSPACRFVSSFMAALGSASVVLSGLADQWSEVPLSLVSYFDDEVDDELDDEDEVVADDVVLSEGVLMMGLTGPVAVAVVSINAA